jgi:hypothetical protein
MMIVQSYRQLLQHIRRGAIACTTTLHVYSFGAHRLLRVQFGIDRDAVALAIVCVAKAQCAAYCYVLLQSQKG